MQIFTEFVKLYSLLKYLHKISQRFKFFNKLCLQNKYAVARESFNKQGKKIIK